MNKLLITIATLFAYSGMFSQTWNTGTGAWISPLSKNIGIQKSLQVGDNLGTDSLWCKTDLNYFEGNVGIGTTTPEAKLHVSISDTTGMAIAHFENNSDNAIMTLHSHADSSAFLLLQTGNKSAFFGLTGVTGEVGLTNGLGSVAIEIDTNNNVTIPDLAGSGTRLVTASATGTLDTTINLSTFTTDTLDNMYAGAGAMPAITIGVTNLAIGKSTGTAITDGNSSIYIGEGADGTYADADSAVVLGFHSFGYTQGVVVGAECNGDVGSIIIGFDCSDLTGRSIVIGNTVESTAQGQFVVGDNANSINDFYLGKGVVAPSPENISMHPTRGAGTNVVAANFTLAAGQGTGNTTTNGYISLVTANAGVSGTTTQSLTEKVRITKGGDILLLNAANGLILKDAAGTPHYWRITISTLGVLTTTDLGTTIPN